MNYKQNRKEVRNVRLNLVISQNEMNILNRLSKRNKTGRTSMIVKALTNYYQVNMFEQAEKQAEYER